METRSSALAEVIRRLSTGLQTAIVRLEEASEADSVYAVMVIANNGYLPGLGVAANSVGNAEDRWERLTETDDASDRDYFYVSVEEWEYFDWDSLEETNVFLDELAELYYNEDAVFANDADINRFFVEAIIGALRGLDLRATVRRRTDPLLTGLGVADPNPNEVDDIIAVSAAVNDPVWHERVAAVYTDLYAD